MIKRFKGSLIYNDNAEYEVVCLNETRYNLSKMLDIVYQKVNQNIDLHIKDKNDDFTLFNESGIVYKSLDSDKINSYKIKNTELEKILFNNVDKEIIVLIDAEVLGENEYEICTN